MVNSFPTPKKSGCFKGSIDDNASKTECDSAGFGLSTAAAAAGKDDKPRCLMRSARVARTKKGLVMPNHKRRLIKVSN